MTDEQGDETNYSVEDVGFTKNDLTSALLTNKELEDFDLIDYEDTETTVEEWSDKAELRTILSKIVGIIEDKTDGRVSFIVTPMVDTIYNLEDLGFATKDITIHYKKDGPHPLRVEFENGTNYIRAPKIDN